MPRPRVHATQSDRQAAYRARKEVTRAELQALKDALCDAAEAGRCSGLTDHLPEEPHLWVAELTRRLRDRKLIVCRRGKE